MHPEQIQEFVVWHTCSGTHALFHSPRSKSRRPAWLITEKVTEQTKVYFLAQTMHLLRWWRIGFRFDFAEGIREPLVHCIRSRSKSSSFGTPALFDSPRSKSRRPAWQTPDKVRKQTKMCFPAQTMHLLRRWWVGLQFDFVFTFGPWSWAPSIPQGALSTDAVSVACTSARVCVVCV